MGSIPGRCMPIRSVTYTHPHIQIAHRVVLLCKRRQIRFHFKFFFFSLIIENLIKSMKDVTIIVYAPARRLLKFETDLLT